MTAIGGFLPLEIAPPASSAPYHAGATALASGRACWHAVLRASRPVRVLLPYFICDAVLQPLVATGTLFDFYALDARFEPTGGVQPGPRELLLVVNYFGVQTPLVAAFAQRHRDRVVIDDTQAFFHRGDAAVWSFNSARKFFGVPDGGFLYGPASDPGPLPPSDVNDCDHLLARLAGDDGRAWDQFREHEARIGIELRAMSSISARLLDGVDMAQARRRRTANFVALHHELGAANTVAMPLDAAGSEGPMCYPFLPAAEVDRAALARLGVYVPTFWPEVLTRRHDGFEWERTIARRLLPLPIDHRYGEREMETLARTLLQVLR
jgi:hypothetical protein